MRRRIHMVSRFSRFSRFSKFSRMVVTATTLAGAAGIATSGPGPASAAGTVQVTTTADSAPNMTASGCPATGTGSCTLREAVLYANDHPGTTIQVPAGTYMLAITGFEFTGAAGDLNLRADVTIQGAGPANTIIDGNTIDRVFYVLPKTASRVSATINGVTVQHGRPNTAGTLGGGGIRVGNRSTVVINDSIIRENIATVAVGGGVDIDGTTDPAHNTSLTIVNSDIVGNKAFGQPDLDSGQAFGGGINAKGAALTLTGVNVVGNTVQGAGSAGLGTSSTAGPGYGGGVAADHLVATGSTFSGNVANGGLAWDNVGPAVGVGGGIFVRSAIEPEISSVVNSTITANQAVGSRYANSAGLPSDPPGEVEGSAGGGGISGLVGFRLIGSTVTGNAVIAETSSYAPVNHGNGGGIDGTSGWTIVNTVVAGNSATGEYALGPDVVLNGTSEIHHSLFGTPVEPSGAFSITGTGAGNLTGTKANPLNPQLGAPGANGGRTQTMVPLLGSPLIGAADPTACTTALPVVSSIAPAGSGGVDQRGTSRPQPAGGACDIGAVEYVYTPSTTTLTSSANPVGVGTPVAITASVTGPGGTPTGTITLSEGGTVLGSGATTSGAFSFALPPFTAPGSHTLTATYSGDTVFAPSAGQLTQVVAEPGLIGGLQFYPLPQPVRLFDTRPGQDAIIHPSAPLTAGIAAVLPGHFSAGSMTIPNSAAALVGNATVDNGAGTAGGTVAPGFATLWPHGSALPLASNLNFAPGTVRPNAFVVGLGAGGQFDLLSNTGGNFIIDITGYYAPPSAGGLYFHPLTQPVRLLDTRGQNGAVVQPGAPLTAGQTLSLPGRFSAGTTTIPVSAQALSGNATVDNTIGSPAGFATLFPNGGSLPPTSSLNFEPGTVAPNAFTVGLGTDGMFNLYSSTGGNFIVDVSGYYDADPEGASPGLLFHPLEQPVRELDTRPGASAFAHPGVQPNAGAIVALPGSFTSGGVTIPTVAAALAGNATIDNTVGAPAGFATIYPAGADLPVASTLNYTPGLVAPNAFIVGLGDFDNSYRLYTQSGGHFIVDISGYYAPPPG